MHFISSIPIQNTWNWRDGHDFMNRQRKKAVSTQTKFLGKVKRIDRLNLDADDDDDDTFSAVYGERKCIQFKCENRQQE